jgi:hypothetical protein
LPNPCDTHHRCAQLMGIAKRIWQTRSTHLQIHKYS